MGKIAKITEQSVPSRIRSRRKFQKIQNGIYLQRNKSFNWRVADDVMSKLGIKPLSTDKAAMASHQSTNNSSFSSSPEPILPTAGLFFKHIEDVSLEKIHGKPVSYVDLRRLVNRASGGKIRHAYFTHYYLQKSRAYALMRDMERQELVNEYSDELTVTSATTAIDTADTKVDTWTLQNAMLGMAKKSILRHRSFIDSPQKSMAATVFNSINHRTCTTTTTPTKKHQYDNDMNIDTWYPSLVPEEENSLLLWRDITFEMYQRHFQNSNTSGNRSQVDTVAAQYMGARLKDHITKSLSPNKLALTMVDVMMSPPPCLPPSPPPSPNSALKEEQLACSSRSSNAKNSTNDTDDMSMLSLITAVVTAIFD
ncbi:hypothetical protein BDF19DRAFT_410308 [Syncephalis fuscata]|nr:hypothetical protein BDF19DRAFT_410308 [Syncephalis fuscata]